MLQVFLSDLYASPGLQGWKEVTGSWLFEGGGEGGEEGGHIHSSWRLEPFTEIVTGRGAAMDIGEGPTHAVLKLIYAFGTIRNKSHCGWEISIVTPICHLSVNWDRRLGQKTGTGAASSSPENWGDTGTLASGGREARASLFISLGWRCNRSS